MNWYRTMPAFEHGKPLDVPVLAPTYSFQPPIGTLNLILAEAIEQWLAPPWSPFVRPEFPRKDKGC
jgi:hypothetical protein